MAKQHITAISLFSGMGGDTLGMNEKNIDVVAYSEFKETFQKTHDSNFPKSAMLGKDVKSDISKIKDEEFQNYKDVDIVFAGFPCQSFSTGGKRKVNQKKRESKKERAIAGNIRRIYLSAKHWWTRG